MTVSVARGSSILQITNRPLPGLFRPQTKHIRHYPGQSLPRSGDVERGSKFTAVLTQRQTIFHRCVGHLRRVRLRASPLPSTPHLHLIHHHRWFCLRPASKMNGSEPFGPREIWHVPTRCAVKQRLHRLLRPSPFFRCPSERTAHFICGLIVPTPPLFPLFFWRHLIGSGERQFVGVQQVVGLIAHGCWPGRKCLTGRGEPLRGGGGAGVEVGIRNSGKHIVISHLTNPNQCCSALPLFKRTGSPPGGIQSPLLHPLLSRLPPTSSPLTASFISTLASACSLADVGRSPPPQPQPPNAFSIKHLLLTINSPCSLSLLVSLHIRPSPSSLDPAPLPLPDFAP